MNIIRKKLSNPSSNGNAGALFEAHVQASFVILMLTGGRAPILSRYPIKKINLQAKKDDYHTDDLIIFTECGDTKEQKKLLCQVKLSVSITKSDAEFASAIYAAWNDFNNPGLFTKNKDVIVLITRPLATNRRNVQWLLDQSKYSNGDEFFRDVNLANFSPYKSDEQLAVIQHHLETANNNVAVSQETLHEFLKHFYILEYDLGEKRSVILSLILSHISQFNRQYPELIWSQAVNIVQHWNKHAGTITREGLPEDLLEAFKKPHSIHHIPEELAKVIQPETLETPWNQYQYETDLALANLIGAWDETYSGDIASLSELTGNEYFAWIEKIQQMLHAPHSPVTLTNGTLWKITKRIDLWGILGKFIFNKQLDAFKKIAVTVLTKRDLLFELQINNGYETFNYDSSVRYSPTIRKGVAEGLVLLGTKTEALINCSREKANSIVNQSIQAILGNADEALWGSLNELLPLLAEAAPDEFLKVVEQTLDLSPCPFDKLLLQKTWNTWGGNRLVGLLWALEVIAWSPEYLVRVCIALGELASRDPGNSNSLNSPYNSLITILLPWFPQTTAPIDKKKVAVQTLCKEHPEIGWKLILSLLPNQQQASHGSYKPIWNTAILQNWKKEVTLQEYWEQVSSYIKIAISLARNDIEKLAELVNHLANFPEPLFEELLNVLSSDTIINLSEEKKLPLWNQLKKLISTHSQFADTDWSLKKESLTRVRKVADKLAPSNLLYLNHQLFSSQGYHYVETRNRKKIAENLQTHREKALKEILKAGGIEAVIHFAEEVESPEQVGDILGTIGNNNIDRRLLPNYLTSPNSKLILFAKQYVRRRYIKGWSWADKLDKSNWSPEQIVQFLDSLPFINETWNRVDKWLGDASNEYWSIVNVDPWRQSDRKLDSAIEKLLEQERPRAALYCISVMYHNKKPLNINHCVEALRKAVLSIELPYETERHDLVKLIHFLQKNSDIPHDQIEHIECLYLPLISRLEGFKPIFLHRKLAANPDFFCDLIQLVYRPKKDEGASNKSSKAFEMNASNAQHLLYEWQRPPGMQDDGSFDDEHFKHWLKSVKEICSASGHIEVALNYVGKVLIYSPADMDGLWINRTVADALNARDAEDMRNGWKINKLNSRGIYRVDPTGTPEKELAKHFQQKAEETENAGFQRLASTLREIADDYKSKVNSLLKS